MASVTASTSSQQLLAANPGRTVASIYNGGTTTLHVIEAPPSVVGERLVPPGMSYSVSLGFAGAVFGWWDGSPTGAATTNDVPPSALAGPVSLVPIGVGALFAVPTNGTNAAPVPLGAAPTGATSFGFYLAIGQTVAYTLASSAAAAATNFAANLYATATNSATTGGDIFAADYFGGLNVYVGAVGGGGVPAIVRARYL